MLMDSPHDRLELDSQLTELIRLRSWIDLVTNHLDFAEEDRFAVQLCVEEAVANIILHGYRSEAGHPIIVRTCASAERTLTITIDDQAPPFSPIEHHSHLPNDMKPLSLESITPGGNGIRLLHGFSGSLSYERLADGNRLIMAFPAP
jgi:serine/threonine-protein kinase RsbW